MQTNTREIIVVRHQGNFRLGVPPVKKGGAVRFSQPVPLQFQGNSPLSPQGVSGMFTVTGEPGRYWFGFDHSNYPYCIEVTDAEGALETATLNVHVDGDDKSLHVKLAFDGAPGRNLFIARENLDDGTDFEVDLVLSNDERLPLRAGEGTNIWNLDHVAGSVQLSVEAVSDGSAPARPLAKRIGQVVGGEMADIEIG